MHREPRHLRHPHGRQLFPQGTRALPPRASWRNVLRKVLQRAVVCRSPLCSGAYILLIPDLLPSRARTSNHSAYFMAKCLADLPQQIISPIVFSCSMYFLVSRRRPYHAMLHKRRLPSSLALDDAMRIFTDMTRDLVVDAGGVPGLCREVLRLHWIHDPHQPFGVRPWPCGASNNTTGRQSDQ